MGYLKQLASNIGTLGKRIIPGTPLGNQEVGLAQLNYTGSQDPADREAIYPQWFFSSRLGQPRQVDTLKMRDLAKSPWAQMVLNTFKKQIYSTAWDVVKTDSEDESNRDDDIKKVKDFLNKINENNQTINDLHSENVTDVGEIDAGVNNYVYSSDSYIIGEVPVYDAWGRVIEHDTGLVLKPLGQRKIVAVKSVDGSSMLKQVDIHKNLLNYWQYSFKHPRQNPTRFEPEEIDYMMMNPRSYSVYGFSPIQSIQQVLELLIQGTRYNKDLYTNNAIPDILVSLPKLTNDALRKLKRRWNNQYKGKPHQVGFINWLIADVFKLNTSNRDLEWLNGQQWYFKLTFAVFGVSPVEAGFFENSNKSNDEGQERVTVRNALKPYFKLFEHSVTNKMITEILQKEDHGLKFEYQPKDQALEKIEFDQDMLELDHKTLTINEFRDKKGRKPLEGGDDPFSAALSVSPFGVFGGGQPPSSGAASPSSKDDDGKPGNPKPKKDDKFSKDLEIDAGDDIIEEAEDYSDFLRLFFDKFEKKVLSAVDKIQLDKSIKKDLGKFLPDLFNAVNSIAFAKHIKKFIKADLVAGMVSAESELNTDIGFTEAYKDKLGQLQHEQLLGYTINGKKWVGIKGVTKELQSKIIMTVQNGINENQSTLKIKDAIKEDFDNFTNWRSEMIARTETNRIVNEGKLLGYKESEIEGGKIVMVAIDNRTSPICLRMHDKYGNNPIPLDNDFIDPQTRKAYRTPPFHVNCRTVLAFRPS